MILRLFSIILCLVAAAFFVGFNLDNKCDVNVIFYTFRQIPVFFTIILSFAAGILFALPFAFIHRHSQKKKKQMNEEKPHRVPRSILTTEETPDSANAAAETEGESGKTPTEEA